MKIKTQHLGGATLDWVVATCEFDRPYLSGGRVYAAYGYMPFSPSTDWAVGGPIIEREKIGILWSSTPECFVSWSPSGEKVSRGPTPLIAAMRCYVASKLGAEVDGPQELLS